MGLFGSILSGVTGGLGDIFQAASSAKAIKKAGNAQLAATQAALAQQQSQFDTTRADNMPFLTAGQDALSDPNGILALLGLSGGDAQSTALSGLKDSPLFKGAYDTGADTILQNQSATGGLRGGNTQSSLAQFGSGLFSNVYQSQLANLMGLVGVGSGTGSTLGQLGQSNANAQSGLLTQQGQIQSGSILGQQGVYNNLSNNLQALIKSVTGGAG